MPRLHSKYVQAIYKKFNKALEKVKKSEISEDIQKEIISSVLEKVSDELKKQNYSSATETKTKYIKVLVDSLLSDVEAILLKANKQDYIKNYKATIKFNKELEDAKQDQKDKLLNE